MNTVKLMVRGLVNELRTDCYPIIADIKLQIDMLKKQFSKEL